MTEDDILREAWNLFLAYLQIRILTDEEIQTWEGLMLCWLDLDPMNYIDFDKWIEEAEDP